MVNNSLSVQNSPHSPATGYRHQTFDARINYTDHGTSIPWYMAHTAVQLDYGVLTPGLSIEDFEGITAGTTAGALSLWAL